MAKKKAVHHIAYGIHLVWTDCGIWFERGYPYLAHGWSRVTCKNCLRCRPKDEMK
jgi:succinate dehydrogenase/fumarate reductase cytochrome b subunit